MIKEVFSKAVQQGEVNDEYERYVTRKGLLYAMASTVLMIIILSLIEIVFSKKIDFGKVALIFWIASYSEIYEGREFNNKKKVLLLNQVKQNMQ